MIAQGYVENGVTVYITSRTASECHQAAAELSKYGTCIAIPSDVSTEEGRNNIVEVISKDHSSLDILVNNAGFAQAANKRFDEYPQEAFEQCMDVNVKAPFLLTQKLYRLLEANASQDNPARVINIGSVFGLQVTRYSRGGGYGPSKAAIHWMTREMAKYFAKDGILVNAIAPGYFESNMTADTPEDFKDEYCVEVPVGRIGQPSDMAGLAIFLVSPASSYINGVVIPLEGGYRL